MQPISSFRRGQKRSLWAILCATLIAFGAATVDAGKAAAWEPTKPVQFIIPAGTGGGADQMARFIQGVVAKNNLMKQPMITVAPTRQLSRPVSIMKPTIATAITATDVATLPSNVPCSQLSADTIGPEPCGLACASAALGIAAAASATVALTIFTGDFLL